jgi:hypothetical protein
MPLRGTIQYGRLKPYDPACRVVLCCAVCLTTFLSPSLSLSFSALHLIRQMAPDRVQQCKPIKEHPLLPSWRETCVKEAASQAGLRYVLAGSNMSRYSSVGSKSSVDGKSSSEELIVLPFYNFTAEHYDQHPPEVEADCTHYCPSPFLYMPLWRSLRFAMDRKFALDEE